MVSWKRYAIIAYILCSLSVAILFMVWICSPASSFECLRSFWLLRIVLILVLFVNLLGACMGAWKLIGRLREAHARSILQTGPDGMTIDRPAVVNNLQCALAAIPGISVQDISVDALLRNDIASFNVVLEVALLGTESTRVMGARIQNTVRQSLYQFTELQTPSVKINFVMPRKRSDVKAAAASADARVAAIPIDLTPSEPFAAPAEPFAAPAESFDAQADPFAAPANIPDVVPADHDVASEPEQISGPDAFVMPDDKPSARDGVGSRFAGGFKSLKDKASSLVKTRSSKHDEDILTTPATSETVSDVNQPDDKPLSFRSDEPAFDDAWPATPAKPVNDASDALIIDADDSTKPVDEVVSAPEAHDPTDLPEPPAKLEIPQEDESDSRKFSL